MKHNSPFTRQIHGNVLIVKNFNINTVKRKDEYNGSKIPNLVGEMKRKITDDKLKLQAKKWNENAGLVKRPACNISLFKYLLSLTFAKKILSILTKIERKVIQAILSQLV